MSVTMTDAALLTRVIPAKAGIQRLMTHATGYPLSRGRQRRITIFSLLLLTLSCALTMPVSAAETPAPISAPISAPILTPTPTPITQVQVQPSHNQAPLWREVRSGSAGVTQVRGVETGVLVQSGGETWRELRNGPVTLYGGLLLCLVLLALAAFYQWRGPIRLAQPLSGRRIARFSPFERAAHWSMAGSFVVLALSGLTLFFGKHVLLPVFGYTLFSWLATICKYLHNFIGPLFLLSVVVAFFLFARDNLWQAVDALWIKKAGGLLSGEHVPTWRFNFGEKTWFWFGVVLLGLGMSATGLVMDFPNFEQGRGLMQTVNILHAVGAMLFIAMSLGHIYIGTIGMEGALDAMRDGTVDETWAKEHHEYWYNEVQRKTIDYKPPAGTTAATQS